MAMTTRAPAAAAFGGHAAWYLTAGAATTALQAALFVALRTGLDAHLANLAAIVVTTLANTEFHRRITFASKRDRPSRRHLQTMVSIVFYASSGSLALLALHALVTEVQPELETVALVITSCAGGIARFLLLRYWVFPGSTSIGLIHANTGAP